MGLEHLSIKPSILFRLNHILELAVFLSFRDPELILSHDNCSLPCYHELAVSALYSMHCALSGC